MIGVALVSISDKPEISGVWPRSLLTELIELELPRGLRLAPVTIKLAPFPAAVPMPIFAVPEPPLVPLPLKARLLNVLVPTRVKVLPPTHVTLLVEAMPPCTVSVVAAFPR